jgi:hypothetical protein
MDIEDAAGDSPAGLTGREWGKIIPMEIHSGPDKKL